MMLDFSWVIHEILPAKWLFRAGPLVLSFKTMRRTGLVSVVRGLIVIISSPHTQECPIFI